MRKSALFALSLVVAVIVALGLVVLSSASGANGVRLHGDTLYFVKRQFFYLAVGVGLSVLCALVDYRIWRDHPALTYLAYAILFVLLAAVFLYRPVNGSHRWIMLGPVNFQPSEFAKIVIVLFVAMWMDRAGLRVELFNRGSLCPMLFIGGYAALILSETDLGSTMVLGAVGYLMMFLGGTRLWHFLLWIPVGLCAFLGVLVTNANRMKRLFDDKALYQSKMALVAIKNGGIWGVGLGESMQKQAYLPEAHTDFIFAIGAEELGLAFSIGVILLYLAFFILSVYIARKATDRFGRCLVMGMAFIVFFQATFNLGVVCGAYPTKGMALPFFSYGGTNLLASFVAVGFILSVGLHSYREKKYKIRHNVLV